MLYGSQLVLLQYYRNFPLMMAIGNACRGIAILRREPSQCQQYVCSTWNQAGIPDGVINVVPGFGER